MTKTTPANLSAPLGRLTSFCGRHFTLMRAACHTGLSSKGSPIVALVELQEGSDLLHNLAGIGWNAAEYTEGRASGKALLEDCEHMLRKLANGPASSRSNPHLTFDWEIASKAIEEIRDAVQAAIIDDVPSDPPSTSEKMAQAIEDLKNRR